MPVSRTKRKTPSDKRSINTALQHLEIAVATKKLDMDQEERLKDVCKKVSAKPKSTKAQNKEKWKESRQALALSRAFPDKKDVLNAAWGVANGSRLRPKYAEDSDAFDKALDYITDTYL
jgi:hypothetical protein